MHPGLDLNSICSWGSFCLSPQVPVACGAGDGVRVLQQAGQAFCHLSYVTGELSKRPTFPHLQLLLSLKPYWWFSNVSLDSGPSYPFLVTAIIKIFTVSHWDCYKVYELIFQPQTHFFITTEFSESRNVSFISVPPVEVPLTTGYC